jgi:hypothetical protein
MHEDKADSRKHRDRCRRKLVLCSFHHGRQQRAPVARIPATILRSESMGRERRERGFHLEGHCHGLGLGREGATAATDAAMGAALELVTSLLQAWRRRGAAWGGWSRGWGSF